MELDVHNWRLGQNPLEDLKDFIGKITKIMVIKLIKIIKLMLNHKHFKIQMEIDVKIRY